MLVIRDQQMTVFREQARRDFEARLARHLQSPDDAKEMLVLASRFQILREADLVQFAGLLLRKYGRIRDLKLPKPAQNILLAYGVPAADRLARFAQWVEAERS